MLSATQYISTLKINHFKQYSKSEFNFHEKFNLISGRNGVGKTNLLDAIYYTCFLKSYYSHSDNLVFSFQHQAIQLFSSILIDDVAHNININYHKENKKLITLNDIPIDKQTEIAGKYPIVFVDPYDQELLHGTSDIRRKFIDATLSLSQPEYLYQLVAYQRCLKQKNALLKLLQTQQSINIDLLNIYDETLLKLNEYIFTERCKFTNQFLPIFNHYYKEIFSGNEMVELKYDSCFYTQNISDFLKTKRNEELRAQKTLYGIHTDDILFFLNNHLAKKIASQGQQKTIVLAIKLAQYEYIKNQTNVKPILFLDDIFDKLDVERTKAILNLVYTKDFGQIFITYTDAKRILSILEELKIVHFKHILL